MGLSIKWMGHASFQIKVDDIIIYIDPYKGDSSEKADIILITHSHFDHCDSSKIRMIQRNDTMFITPRNCTCNLDGRIEMLKSGDKFDFGLISVEAVDAYNIRRFRSPGIPFHPKGFGVGYLITAKNKTIYHAGDTDFIPEMRQLGSVDVALLPSGDTYTMDNKEAAEAALAISPGIVVPMHRWDTDADVLKERVESRSNIEVRILKVGETLEIV